MNGRSLTVFTGAACLVLLAAVLPSRAQEMAQAPGLELSEFNVKYVPSWSSRRSLARGLDVSNLSDTPARFELAAVFRNTGERAITSVSWEFLFFEDEQQTKLMLRHKYRDGKRILPGEQVRLEHVALKGAATPHKAVRITRVAYADGTVWQAARAKP
ncbi:MAG TPA: hypothetical protein VF656_09060 [Pyrinomonadaceae bacterium]|jgi:hypothetical protein